MDWVNNPIVPLGLLLWIQTGELRQQQAVALGDGLLGGGCCQVALEGQDLLLLSLGDLQLPVDHLRLCVVVGDGARRVCIVTTEGWRKECQSGAFDRETTLL